MISSTKGQQVETNEAEKNQGYVNYINSVQPREYTYEELKAMGLPTFVTPEGFITWE